MNDTILIIDDVKVNIDALTDILSGNYKIITAISGENAIRLLEQKKPALVLLDVSMPCIDGFGVLQYMKSHKEFENIPVIFITGEHGVTAEEQGLIFGAADYIKKPFVKEIIEVKIQNYLELKTYRDNLRLLVYERTKQLEKRTRQFEKSIKRLTASRDAVIMGMSLMSDVHDNITGAHIERIKIFTKILTDKLIELYPYMIKEDSARQIVSYSPLHDVGKVGISDIVLKKTSRLTPEEYNAMINHTRDGAELLRKAERFLSDDSDGESLKTAIEIAEFHHEKFDGSGYPHGLKGEEIPLSARIVAVADVYDALRSPRHYKNAYTHEEAVNIILLGDGRTSPDHFDPDVLEAFRIVRKEFEKVIK